jgi:hypothetical protein
MGQGDPANPSRLRRRRAQIHQRNKAADSDGLDDVYSSIGSDGTSDFDGLTYKQIFLNIAKTTKAEYDKSLTPEKVGKDTVDSSEPSAVPETVALPTEMVFARGLHPLQNGVDFKRGTFKVFGEWTGILID